MNEQRLTAGPYTRGAAGAVPAASRAALWALLTLASAALPPASPAHAQTPTDPANPTPPGGADGKGTVAVGGKQKGDTTNLPQFEQAMEFEPRNANYKVAFSLEDADLSELVKVIGQLTGKRFIFGNKVKSIKATIYSPQKVTVAEAYQAFLSILETNGLTVMPHGRFLKIVETAGAATQGTPIYKASQGATTEDRYITRMHRLNNVGADEVAAVLNKFKSKDADITVYGPGNMLIITDTGANIRRMMTLVEDIDVAGVGDQVWIEPVYYGVASDMASRINDVFDLKAAAGAAAAPGAKPGAPPAGAAGASELHVGKVMAEDRTNSLIIVSTERAYLRILEFLKRIDVPQTGEGEIHVLPLQHAEAKDLAKTIQEIVTGAASGGGPGAAPAPAGKPAGSKDDGIFEGRVKVSADNATNSIVITSSPRDYAQVRAVIDKLDRPRRQVFIDAVIMDLNVTRALNLGVSFHGAAPIGSGAEQSLILGGLNAGRSASPTIDPSLLQGVALGVRGPGVEGSQNLFGTGLTIPAVGAVLNMLAVDSDADVLSTPHILATDNVPAEINVGENVPLQQSFGGIGIGGLPAGAGAGAAGAGVGALAGLAGLGGIGIGGQPQRQDVGTKIKIIPHLNESDEVRLELTEEISEAQAPQGQLQVVPITKRTAQTTLVVKDQQTVVVGGLMRTRVTHSLEKVPLLGDIPVLGLLFRNTRNATQKTNLVLVLTPYIIREQADLRTVFERKMHERQEFLDRYFVFTDDNDYKPPKDYSRTNGLVEDIRQAYLAADERQRLDELVRPKQLRTHSPGEPLQMPATRRAQTGGAPAATPGAAPQPAGAPAPGAAPTPTRPPRNPRVEGGAVAPPGGGAPPPDTLNLQPPRRGVDRIEP